MRWKKELVQHWWIASKCRYEQWLVWKTRNCKSPKNWSVDQSGVSWRDWTSGNSIKNPIKRADFANRLSDGESWSVELIPDFDTTTRCTYFYRLILYANIRVRIFASLKEFLTFISFKTLFRILSILFEISAEKVVSLKRRVLIFVRRVGTSFFKVFNNTSANFSH